MLPFAKTILNWYAQNARKLPWRGHADPYAIWVSEIMLQQTRVEAVVPYFERWMKRFPTLEKLATASQQDVLSTWEGLGYYSRARNLHRATQIVMAEYDGKIPENVEQLRQLPGVGRYTAGAIASMAFGQDAPALDGNIRRVLGRVFNVTEPARSPQGEARLWALAEENLPQGKAGDYNQAMMDLGAMICLPRAPGCINCPLQSLCQAHALGVEEQRPVSLPKKAIPHYTVTAAVIERDGMVLLAQRQQDDLLGGLWEFPGGKVKDGEELPACLKREILEELGAEIEVGEAAGIYRHAYTHFRVTLHAFRCQLTGGTLQPIQAAALVWVRPGELGDYPMGKIDRQISRYLMQNLAGG
ncbi:MAG: A/G-specific adenine glycosylase [Anaerolineales bacterium]|nr:A/G-specific adenine glycosylase [Anaerolineales bacterium]